MTRNTFLALAAAASLLVGGCKPKVDYKYKIAVIPKGQTHEFWQSIERGARRAAADLAELGIAVEILWDAPLKESDAQDQITRVQRNATSRGIHGLVLAPQNSEGMVSSVEQTVERGIPVVIIDSGLAKPELMVKYVATNNYNGGKMAAQHLLSVLAKEGKTAPRLVLFRYQTGSESTEQREKGFLDFVNDQIKEQKKAGKPTIEVIDDREYAGATVETAQRAAGPLLARVKDTADGIFAVNESATTGLLNALRSKDLNKKIHLMGFDSSQALQQAVEEGDVDGLIVQDPYRMGYLGVWVLVRHLEGDDVSAGGKELSTGENLVTRDNLRKPETRQLFEPDLQAKRTIQVPKFPKKKP
jgi:ribose transport system substrate-binding protein